MKVEEEKWKEKEPDRNLKKQRIGWKNRSVKALKMKKEKNPAARLTRNSATVRK